MNDNFLEHKAPQDVIFDLPQERITGDILRGYGPRRGNLERLLRYWRPIMRKPGGFRRCRIILANHPELYPLSNICAWLHHETTGKWPNEGCHHPGMKNCKGKLRKLERRLSGAARAPKKISRSLGFTRSRRKSGDYIADESQFYSDEIWRKQIEEINVVTRADENFASHVLGDFADMEPEFIKYLIDQNNWEQEGEDENGRLVSVKYPELKCCPDSQILEEK